MCASTTTTTAAAATAVDSSLSSKAEVMLRLEELVFNQKQALVKKRTDEEAKLFKSLSAITSATDTARFAAALKTYAAAESLIAAEEASVSQFSKLLQKQMDGFPREGFSAMMEVLKARLAALLTSQKKERSEADAYDAEIAVVKRRMEQLEKSAGLEKSKA